MNNVGFARIAGIIAIGVAVAALFVAVVSYKFSRQQTPPGQPPLVYLNNQTVEELRAAFNAAADQTRVLAMVSPT